MMLMTPLTAFAPQIAAPGPRITSMRSMLSRETFCESQKTPAKIGVYTVRSVDQYEEFVGVLAVEAACADRPPAGVDLGHVEAGNHAQQVRNVERPGASYVFP